jgi:hypothetical protein
MRLKDIKTADEFYKVADIWLNRSSILQDIYLDKTQTKEKQYKALKLWKIMLERVLKLNLIANQMNMPKTNNFKVGGC